MEQNENMNEQLDGTTEVEQIETVDKAAAPYRSEDEDEKRAERRRRRRKNQILVYLVSVIIVIVLAVGIVYGVKRILTYMESRRASEIQESQQTVIEQITADEEILEQPDVPETAEPIETLPGMSDAEKLDEIVNAVIEVMPIEDKVAGLFIVTPESVTGVNAAVQAGEGTQNALSRYAVGGIVYSDKNIQSAEQFKEMISNTELYSKYPLFIAVEEEGGSNSPVAGNGLAEPQESASDIGISGDANRAYQAGTNIAAYLTQLGINLDFAPVADLANVDNSVMSSRSYGQDAATVSPFVTAMISGLQDNGITACLKYFPGGGSATVGTDEEQVIIDRTLEELQDQELTVFRAGIEAGVKIVMVGNMTVSAISTDGMPASMSKEVVTDCLREELGFDGVIITADMSEAAISDNYGADQAAVMALRAGCDMVLMPSDFEQAYEGVLTAVQDGTISEERINDSLRRIYRIKYADRIQN